MRKRIIVLFGIMGMLLFGGCGTLDDLKASINETEEEDAVDTPNDTKQVSDEEVGKDQNTEDAGKNYGIGDTVSMVHNASRMDITLTEWGTVYDTLSEEILTYVSFTVVNTGEDSIYVYNEMFNVYVDDYSAKYTAWFDDDSNMPYSADLSPGRKFSGTFYLQLDPDDVSNIEVELGNVVFVVKDEKTQKVNTNNTKKEDTNTSPANLPQTADSTGAVIPTYDGHIALEDYLYFDLSADGIGEMLQMAGLDFVMDESGYYRSDDASVWIYNTDMGGSEIVISPSEYNLFAIWGVYCGMDVEDAMSVLEDYGAVDVSPPISVNNGTGIYILFDSYTMTIKYDEDWSKIDEITFDCFLW